MRRKDLVVKMAQTLLRRRAALRTTLERNASLIAVDGGAVGDSVDAAVDCEQDELDSQLATVESRELAAIDAALGQMRDGRYGTCEGCGKPIPSARLQALPYATLCIQCQREEEQFGHGWAAAFHWQRETHEGSGEEPNQSEPNQSDGLKLDLV